jgi:hypothetical protein
MTLAVSITSRPPRFGPGAGEGDAVDDGRDEAGVGDDGSPLAEGEVATLAFLFSLGQDLEQQLRAPSIQLQVANLVQA